MIFVLRCVAVEWEEKPVLHTLQAAAIAATFRAITCAVPDQVFQLVVEHIC
ncbi:MAG: hypothetical protein JO323_19395 [Acidobacteriia bacterium]|nr:hypothetical protein [Terriglobia bacterium]